MEVKMSPKSVKQMVHEAGDRVENLSVADVAAEVRAGEALLLDIREASELLQKGSIPGAVSAPRGMLEFYADRGSPDYRRELHPARRTILYCARGDRSALAADTLQQLGYSNVAHLEGGLQAWEAAGLPVLPALTWYRPLRRESHA
jgi:rhodanese-related sulfurtransferase